MDSIFTLKDLVAPVVSQQFTGRICTDADQGQAFVAAMQQAPQCYQSVSYQQKVVVLVSNTVDTIAAMIQLWHQGAVVIPAKREMSASALQTIIDDCGADYVLDPQQHLLTPVVKSQLHAIETPVFSYLTPPKLTGVDLALIIYTSGSTGKPKGIMLTHANVISALRSILAYLQIKADDRILLISPLSFDYGLYQLLFCLATGCDLVVTGKTLNPIQLVSLVEKQHINVLPLIPALASSLHKYLERFAKTVAGVRLITSTGGVFPAHTALGLQQQFIGADVVKMYGLTESKRVSYLPATELGQRSDSVGIPMPGLDGKIFKEVRTEQQSLVLQELPAGEIGQLYVRGTSVFQRYFNVEGDAGAKIIAGRYRDDHWLATGDLFMKDADGYLYFKGRVKDLIKQRGFCIYPRDMEAIVYQHPGVEICAVVGARDSADNEIAKLFVVLVQQNAAAEAEFKQWLVQTIDADYMFAQVQFLAQMPLSLNGKVDLTQLTKAA
jgi:acyl-CoA synthetase (AMP-forming)/AMP-acid ligase II